MTKYIVSGGLKSTDSISAPEISGERGNLIKKKKKKKSGISKQFNCYPLKTVRHERIVSFKLKAYSYSYYKYLFIIYKLNEQNNKKKSRKVSILICNGKSVFFPFQLNCV